MSDPRLYFRKSKGSKGPDLEFKLKFDGGERQKRAKERAASLSGNPAERPIANQPVFVPEPTPAVNNSWGIFRRKTTTGRNGAKKEQRVEDPAPERVAHPGSGFPVDRFARRAGPTSEAYPKASYANEANEAYANEPHANGVNEAYANEPYANEANETYANEPYANEPYANEANETYANEPHANGANGAYANGAYANGAYANGAYANEAYANKAYANEAYANKAYANEAYANKAYANKAYTREAYTREASRLADQLDATHLTEHGGEPAMPQQPPTRERVNKRTSKLPGGYPESDRDSVREQYTARGFQTRYPSLQTSVQTQARCQPVPCAPPVGLQRGIPQPTAASPIASRSNVSQPALARPAYRSHQADEIMVPVTIPKQVQVPASVVAGKSPADAYAAAAAYTGTTVTPAASSMASYTVHDEEEYQWQMEQAAAASLAGTQSQRASSRAPATLAYGNVPWLGHTTGRAHSTTSASTPRRTRFEENPALEDPRVNEAEAIRIRDPIQLPSRSSRVDRPASGVGRGDRSEHAAAALSPGRSSFPNRGLLPGFHYPMNNRRNTTGPPHQADIYMREDSTGSQYGDGPVIKLRVRGFDGPSVNVHLSKLRSSSRKFRKLNENSIMQHGYVDADGDFHVVRAYVNWLYNNKIPIAGFERSMNSRAKRTMNFLVKLYGYAWRIWDVKFMNDIMRGLIHTIREADWVPNPTIVTKVYEEAHREKGRDGWYREPLPKLRLLMIDVWVWQELKHPLLNDELHDTPERFRRDVVGVDRRCLSRMSRPHWEKDPQSYLHD